MHFLNPLALIGLIAAGVPLLLHLLAQRRIREIPFPGTHLLFDLVTDHIRFIRFRQLLLLIIRTLLVIAIVMGFARPTLRGFFRSGGQVAVAVVVDRSASMEWVEQGEKLADQTVRMVDEVLGLCRPGDTAAILLTGVPPVVIEPGMTTDYRQLAARFRQTINIAPAWTPGGGGPAIEAAIRLLAESNAPNRELYIVTDGIGPALPDSLATMLPDGIRLRAIMLGPDERTGTVITDMRLENSLPVAGQALRFRVEGVSAGENAGEIEFFAGTDRVGKTSAESLPGGGWTADFTWTAETPGWYSLTAVAGTGAFEPGERRYLAVQAPPRRRILIVGTSASTYYLSRALNPDDADSLVSLRVLEPAMVRSADIRSADVTVLAGIDDLSPEVYQALVSSVINAGTGLIVFPPAGQPGVFYTGSIFRELFPATLGGVKAYPAGQEKAVSWFDTDHPLLRGLSTGAKLTHPKARRIIIVDPGSEVSVAARFEDRTMAIGEAQCGRGRVVMVALDTDGTGSDFVMNSLFAPFMARTLQHVSGDDVLGGVYESGDALVERIDRNETGEVAVKSTDGPARRIESVTLAGERVVTGEIAGMPGVYSVTIAGNETARFAVNAPAAELNLGTRDNERGKKLFGPDRWMLVDATKPLAGQVDADRYGREITAALFWLALFLIVAETVIARRG